MEGTFEGQKCFHSDQRLEGYPSPFIRKDGFGIGSRESGRGNLLLRLPRLTGQDLILRLVRSIMAHYEPNVGTILRGEGCGTL